MTDLPDMSEVLDEWLQSVIHKTVTGDSGAFDINDLGTDDGESVAPVTIQSVVQPADKDKLNTANIDWSLDYQMFHTKSNVIEGDFIEFDGRDYKIISRGAYGQYGYFELIGEETKRAVKT